MPARQPFHQGVHRLLLMAGDIDFSAVAGGQDEVLLYYLMDRMQGLRHAFRREGNLFPDGDWSSFVIDPNDQDGHSALFQRIHFVFRTANFLIRYGRLQGNSLNISLKELTT